MNKAYSYYKEMTPCRTAVVIGGIIITGLVSYAIIKKIKNDAQAKKDLEESSLASSELAGLASQGIVPTLSSTQIESIIKKIVVASNGCFTDEQSIYDGFKELNNKADLLLLLKMWGIQYIEPCAASQPISYAEWLYNSNSFGGNLSTFLNYGLNASKIANINDILSQKGIVYNF